MSVLGIETRASCFGERPLNLLTIEVAGVEMSCGHVRLCHGQQISAPGRRRRQ